MSAATAAASGRHRSHSRNARCNTAFRLAKRLFRSPRSYSVHGCVCRRLPSSLTFFLPFVLSNDTYELISFVFPSADRLRAVYGRAAQDHR